jgi:dTDP-4-dehydrorhamnose 3,5-epimerase
MPGLVELHPHTSRDKRGHSVRTLERQTYIDLGLPVVFAEEMHTFSRREVLRGMHFQAPPVAQGKVVFCQHGTIFDVVLDLRRGSPTYGRTATFELDGERGNGLYVPEGLAHGFCVPGDGAVVSYRMTTGYSPENEGGVRWDSIGVAWPVADPVLSQRDGALPPLDAFDSPFVYEEAGRA